MKRRDKISCAEWERKLTLEEYVFALQVILQTDRHRGVAGVLIPDSAERLAKDPGQTEKFYKSGLKHGVFCQDTQGNVRLEQNLDTVLKAIHKSRRCLTIQKESWERMGILAAIYWYHDCYFAALQDKKNNTVHLLIDHRSEAVYQYLEKLLLKKDGVSGFRKKALNQFLKGQGYDKSEIGHPQLRIQGTRFNNRTTKIQFQENLLLKEDKLESFATDGDAFQMQKLEASRLKETVLEWMEELVYREPESPEPASCDEKQPDPSGIGTVRSRSRLRYDTLTSNPGFPRSGPGYIWWTLKNIVTSVMQNPVQGALLPILGYLLFAVFSMIWNLYGTCYINDTFFFDRRCKWGDIMPYLLSGTIYTPIEIKGFQVDLGITSTAYIVFPLSAVALVLLQGWIARIKKAGPFAVLKDILSIPSLVRDSLQVCHKPIGYFVRKGIFYSCIFGFLLFNPLAAALLFPLFLFSFAQGEDSTLAVFLMTWRTAVSTKRVNTGKMEPVSFEEVLLDIFGVSVGFAFYSLLNLVLWNVFDYHFWLRLVMSILLAALALLTGRSGNGEKNREPKQGKTSGNRSGAAIHQIVVVSLCLLAVFTSVLMWKTGVVLADDGGWSESGRSLQGLFTNAGFGLILGLSVLTAALAFGAALGVAAIAAGITFGAAALFAGTTDYGRRTAQQVVYGRYSTSEPTLLGTVLDIGIGMVPGFGNVWGVISGARDVTYDVTHWEGTFSDYIHLGIDCFGLGMSGIGLKNDLSKLSPGKVPVYENSRDQIIRNVENGETPLQNTIQKGNYGEMKTDQLLESRGYQRLSLDKVDSLDAATHRGIDGVYYNANGHPPYIIAETKYGTSQLGKTLDGKQMSSNWIDNRLDAAVGQEMADQIRMESLLHLENVQSQLFRVESDGKITSYILDDMANILK